MLFEGFPLANCLRAKTTHKISASSLVIFAGSICVRLFEGQAQENTFNG